MRLVQNDACLYAPCRSMSSSKPRLARPFAKLRHLRFLLSHLCCLGSTCLFLGVDVFCKCVEQLHFAVTEQNQSSCTMASIFWLDAQSLYLSFRCSAAGSGKLGRRASVLQVWLSAYLRSANSLYTLVSIKICGE